MVSDVDDRRANVNETGSGKFCKRQAFLGNTEIIVADS